MFIKLVLNLDIYLLLLVFSCMKGELLKTKRRIRLSSMTLLTIECDILREMKIDVITEEIAG